MIYRPWRPTDSFIFYFCTYFLPLVSLAKKKKMKEKNVIDLSFSVRLSKIEGEKKYYAFRPRWPVLYELCLPRSYAKNVFTPHEFRRHGIPRGVTKTACRLLSTRNWHFSYNIVRLSFSVRVQSARLVLFFKNIFEFFLKIGRRIWRMYRTVAVYESRKSRI